MQSVLEAMEHANNRLNILILDACRDNPFEELSRSSGRSGGLAKLDASAETEKETFIAYAAAPGKVAFDGKGSNSPFTEALVEKMKIPGLKIEEVFKKVRKKVLEASEKKQQPWQTSSMVDDFYFVLPDQPEVIPDPNPGSGIITQAQEQWRRARLAERERVAARIAADRAAARIAADIVNPISANVQQLAEEKRVFSEFTDRQPSPKHVNDKGMTDLHIAVMLNLAVLTKSLVLREAEINAKDKNGKHTITCGGDSRCY